MDQLSFEKHKPFAGEKKPSMHRRRVGHDYEARCIYLITMTVEGRRPILGTLLGDVSESEGSPDAPRVELSPLGEAVKQCWQSIPDYYPEAKPLALQLMPDHLHGIIFITRAMQQHLGIVLKGFKAGCNKCYRELCEPEGRLLQQCRGIENKEGGGEEDKRAHGFLFSRNYNDHILDGAGELERWFQYLRDNPRRLAIRQAHSDYFRVRFGVAIGPYTFAAIGNRFLLHHPERVQVQSSRSLSDELVAATVEQMLARARKGAVLVSPAISKGEQAVMRAMLEARLPLIFLTPWGFNTFSRPGHQYYEACAEGRFLILAPWEHQNQRIPLTRDMCMQLNDMAAVICAD